MQFQRVPFDHIRWFSQRDIDQTLQVSSLLPFQKYPVSLDAFQEIIRDKMLDKTDRSLLVDSLTKQYETLFPGEPVPTNVKKLAEQNTFTITTAHQPVLFTGPLYFVFKILSAVSLARGLQEKFPAYHFVPVYVCGGEDHDFEEVNHAHLFGKTIRWQQEASGSVGRMRTENILPLLETLQNILGTSQEASELMDTINLAYRHQPSFGKATLALVHRLFEDTGLIVIDMDRKPLKKAFIPVMEEELFNRPSINLVNETSSRLEKLGYKQQATPRPINLFYLGDQMRERIEWQEDSFSVVNTKLIFTREEMRRELHTHPDRFSPNVVLRPLYQELILPNLAYVGGGGEIAYWLERKTQFEHFRINFPMLVRRHSVLWVDKSSARKLEKLKLDIRDFLHKDLETIIKDYVRDHAENPLQLKREKHALADLFENIAATAGQIDPTLVKTVHAEKASQLKSLSLLESKLIRAEKQKHEVAINQIRGLEEKLFPSGSFQERHDNFAAWYAKYGKGFFKILENHFEPLENQLLIFTEA